ncbi:hypothetical protein B0H13DRAFT_1887052 [Mycena leptocephala]|nr:hypothetical protein B0H13DRAFT_1887052 [Mycena leptocephala]
MPAQKFTTGLNYFNLKKVWAEDDCTQPLYNEQAVAYDFYAPELYFKNVIAPTKQGLDTVLKPLLNRPDLKKAGYFFNVSPISWELAQIANGQGKDRTRCDHYLVLEHMDKVTEDPTWAPPKDIVWQSPDDFRRMLAERNDWDGDEEDSEAPAYPRLVLAVIEEKKPNAIDPDAFKAGREKKRTTSEKNVAKMLPQIKKYSVDAQCPLVVLTDYNNTMLLEVVNAGAKRTENGRGIVSTPDVPVVKFSQMSDGPRFALFASAIKRLVEAGLLSGSPYYYKKKRGLMF